MSSFRRLGRGAKSSTVSARSPQQLIALQGVKPWTGGIHLTSVGLNQLDNVLGGGQPIGTCIFLEDDRWTRDLAHSLLKYWCAEAVSQDQNLVFPVVEDSSPSPFAVSTQTTKGRNIVSDEIFRLLMALPRNLHWVKTQEQQSASPSTIDTPSALSVLEEDDQGENFEEGLEIAWQYKKSVQEKMLAQPFIQQRSQSSSSNAFCHSYDLSARMTDQKALNPADYIVRIRDLGGCCKLSPGILLFRELVSLLKKNEGKAFRMVLYNTNPALMSVALPLFLSHVRKHKVAVVLLVYSQPSKDYKSLSRLSGTCDVVLKTEGFSARRIHPPPPEFRLLQGILTISKISTVTSAAATGGGFFGDISFSKRPAAFVYGFKRDRRKLHISLLHIPPEDYARGGGSVGSGVRSGAGTNPEKKKTQTFGCASNSGGSALDF
ncbi:unnamed protein product [Cylindrotheca closterium]|uniref:Elongator complex protein 4 n=1 Tax=Cylindrotheca closterium TaxID=2856 RepID=A0AAD2FRC8_9STRA|nr:unnamed protein product [Cylindrotheca closterium]